MRVRVRARVCAGRTRTNIHARTHTLAHTKVVLALNSSLVRLLGGNDITPPPSKRTPTNIHDGLPHSAKTGATNDRCTQLAGIDYNFPLLPRLAVSADRQIGIDVIHYDPWSAGICHSARRRVVCDLDAGELLSARQTIYRAASSKECRPISPGRRCLS